MKTSAASAPECGKNKVFHWELSNLTWNIQWPVMVMSLLEESPSPDFLELLPLTT